jgi:hypothetical protein
VLWGPINDICIEYRWQPATIFPDDHPESDEACGSKPEFDRPGFGKPAFNEFRFSTNRNPAGSKWKCEAANSAI